MNSKKCEKKKKKKTTGSNNPLQLCDINKPNLWYYCIAYTAGSTEENGVFHFTENFLFTYIT